MLKHALAIGINTYKDETTLAHAVDDAQDIASILSMTEYGFDSKLLINEQATTDQVKLSITQLLSGPAGIKFLYFAGHGKQQSNGIYLATSDSDKGNPGIELQWLRERISKSPSSVVLVLDSCFSGSADPGQTVDFFGLTEDIVDSEIGKFGAGKILLAACGSTISARETNTRGHGLFTFYLLEGLYGPAANSRGVITPHSLYDFVSGHLIDDGRQVPIFRGEQAGVMILGGGFDTRLPLTLKETGADEQEILEIEAKAKAFLDNYITQTTVRYEEWKKEGFKKAGQLLTPLLRWFDAQLSSFPALRSRPEFTQAHSEARARLSQLGMIAEGIACNEGTVASRLGAGAFGAVWKVIGNEGQEFAYKIYHSNELAIREKVTRFRRGYDAMRQLDHPNIVKVHGYTEAPVGFHMDFISGPNLREFGESESNPIDLVQMLLTIAETLKHAHGRNVVHRDVKPENILLNFNSETNVWNPYLSDFDLAWFSTATQVTKEAFGVMAYAAPEQLTKPSSQSAHAPTTDIFSFGQLCFFASTRSDPVPFGAADNKKALHERIGRWPSASAASEFTALYGDCSQNDPALRPKDFEVICRRLFRVLQLLRNTNPLQRIDDEGFTKELMHAVIGTAPDLIVSSNSFRTKTGRTVITVSDVQIGRERLECRIKFQQTDTMIPGVDFAKARQILNRRIADSLDSYEGIERRNGNEGGYDMNLYIRNRDAQMKTVEECREIISRVINAMERI